MTAQKISRIAILASLCIALRFAFFPFANIKPITAIFLVSSLFLPMADAFLIMALTMVGTAIYMGFGIVVLWQILSFAVIMLVWKWAWFGLRLSSWNSVLIPMLLAAVVTFLYGLVISLLSALQFGVNPWVYWLNGLSFDVAHAVSTALFYPIIDGIFRRFIK